tara:strand:+ start:4970 stop:5575 length:606 start_codon:yes stop_codon:yes gene_type:complete
MTYFLGRDVKVYIGTETDAATVQWKASATGSAFIFTDGTTPTTDYTMLAAARDNSDDEDSRVEQLSGVDLSIGAMDEDTTYLGFRGVTKVEIKKETTISLTRKKQDASWDELFNDGRFGVSTTNTAFHTPGVEPFQDYGYRIWVKLKDSADVFTLRNCCIQSHSVSNNVDGTTDETLEFMSYVEPVIATASIETITPTTAL